MQKNNIISYSDKKILSFIADIVLSNSTAILQKIQQELDPLWEENYFLLNPDSFLGIIEEQLAVFISFLKTAELQGIIINGRKASAKGLDEDIILSIFNILKCFFKEYFQTLPFNQENHDLLLNALDIVDICKETYYKAFKQQCIEQNENELTGLYESLHEAYSTQKTELAEKDRQLQQEKYEALELLNEQIKMLSIKLKEYLLGMAHDTINPLCVVLNKLLIILDHPVLTNIKTLPSIINTISTVIEMMRDILDQEKSERGQNIYDLHPLTDISGITVEKIELFKEVAADRNIKITSEIGENIIVQIQKQTYDRILHNVIDNSLKYNKDNGSVHVVLKKNNGDILLTVEDTGMGIPKKQLQYLFASYSEVDFVKKTVRGTGLGLPLVKSLLREVSGKITVASRENAGTLVSITFKKPKSANKPEKQAANDDRLKKPLKYRKRNLFKQPLFEETKNTILFVDDKEELILHLFDLFGSEYNFMYARDGNEALEKLHSQPTPDIFIFDIVMGVTDGLSLFKTLQGMERYSDIPCLLLTAIRDTETMFNALNAGVIDYLEKPVADNILRAKVRAILKNRGKLIVHQEEKIEQRVVRAVHTNDDISLKRERLFKQYKITARERAVICHLCDGLSYKMAGEKLCLSEAAVKKHVKNIKMKCNAETKFDITGLFQ